MSTRTTFRPQTVINSGSMSANITSSPTILQSLSMLCYQVIWTGASPVGTLSFQGSNTYALNPDGTVLNAGIWTPLVVTANGSQVSVIAISGNSGDGLIDGIQTGAYALRLVYTFTSGTGSLSAVASGKVT